MKNLSRIFFALLFLSSAFSVAYAQELVVIHSQYLNRDDSVFVFTPSSYQQGEDCPSLYLLHGYSGDYKDWSRHMDVQALADRTGFIIICPDGFYNGWYVNSSNTRGPQWRSFFDRELYPHIQSTYFTNPETCFITGLSMGGHGAVNVFIDNPDRFCAVGTMSGVLDLRQTPLRETEVSEVLGEYSTSNARFYTESAINRLEDLAGSGKPILISCGYDDNTYAPSSLAFAERCKALKVPYFLMMSPGSHSWDFWTYAIEEQISLFGKMLRGENLGYKE